MSTIALAARRTGPALGRIPIARWLLYLLILVFPFFSIEPKIFRPDWWVGALLIAAFGLGVLRRGKLRLDPIGKAALGLHVAVLLSVTVNFWGWGGSQWAEFFTLWLQLLFATLLYLALANLKLSQGQLHSLLRFWVFIAVVIALYGLYQVLARNLGWPLAYLPYLHPHPEKLPSGLAFAGYARPSSMLREPTYLGMYLLAPLVLTAFLLFKRQGRVWLFHSQQANYGAFLVILMALLSSFAIAAYITLVVVFLVGLLLDRRARKPLLRTAGILLVITAILVPLLQVLEIPFINALVGRGMLITEVFFGNEGMPVDPSTRTRLQEVILALNVWVHHPIFGVGLNQLQFVGAQYALDYLLPRLAERGCTHNMWLGVLVQTGVVGFFFFSLMWFQGLRMMRRAFRHGEEPLRWLALAFLYILLATIVRGFAGGPFTFTLYWFYLGMASIIYRLSRSVEDARLGEPCLRT